MNEAKTCETSCSKDLIKQWFSEGIEISSELLQNCDMCFQEFARCEEALVSLFPFHAFVDELDHEKAYYEVLDLDKAERLMGDGKGHELPDFLKHYTSVNLSLPEDKNDLVVRLSSKGIQILNRLMDSMRILPSLEFIPSLRSVDSLSSDNSSVIFEEAVSEDQTFYYQIIQENSEEVYLSVKAESSEPGFFHQVHLRKEGRFILSSKTSADGMTSFSGLKSGNYSIEFQADHVSKSFDLCILVG